MSFTQNIQPVAPTLNINFTKSNRLDSRISFSRSGSGTYFNSQGVLTTAPVNTPRFQNEFNSTLNRWVPKGLLVEESRTNKATNSVIFHSASTVIPYYEIAPDGTLTALAYQPPNDPNTAGTHEKHAIFPGLSINVGDTVTIFAKRKPGSNLKFLHLRIFTSGWFNSYNLETGAVSINNAAMPGSMTNVGNGWWRCQFTNFASAGNTGLLRIWVSTNGSIGNATNGDPLYLWGLQSETGITPTSYISTFPLFSSRASSATYYDSTGIIRTAVTNEARSAAFLPSSTGTFARVGTLLEGAATNSITRSNTGNPEFPSSGVVTSPSFVGLDNATAGTQVVVSSTQVNTGLRWGGWTGTTSNVRSFYVKVLSGSGTTFTGQGGSGDPYTWNISNLTYSSDARHPRGGVIPVGNGWYRCWIGPNSATEVNTGGGNYLVPVSVGTYLFWGFQVETGTYPTSYISTAPTFTSRASTATYYDSTGTIRTAAINEARNAAFLPTSTGTFSSAGLLLESASTNIVNYSQEFNNSYWVKTTGGTPGTTVTANVGVAPDGTTTADLIDYTTAIESSKTVEVTFDNSPAGKTYTGSVFIKGTAGQTINLYLNGAGVDIVGEQFTLNGTWQRLSITRTYPSDFTVSALFRFGPRGIGMSAGTATQVQAWGAQVESGSVMTSYIPTAASAVTRAADVSSASTATRAADVSTSSAATRAADNVSISGTNFTNIHNPTENTLVSIGEENLYTLSSTALTINSNSKLDSTVSNLIYYPKALQYASLNASKAYPSIVSNGLVLNLDAGVRKSYIGSGTTWRDLSNNINATLSNGPTFNSENGGSIVFDGVDDRITLGTPTALTALFGTSAVSVEVWLRRSANITAQKIIFDSGTNEHIQMDITSNQLAFLIGTPTGVISARSSTLDLNIWYHYVGVYDGATITTYLNSIQSSQIEQTGNIATDSGGFFIASYTSGFNFPGRISSVKIYNKALSSVEIAQNFNAHRRRYGI